MEGVPVRTGKNTPGDAAFSSHKSSRDQAGSSLIGSANANSFMCSNGTVALLSAVLLILVINVFIPLGSMFSTTKSLLCAALMVSNREPVIHSSKSARVGDPGDVIGTGQDELAVSS